LVAAVEEGYFAVPRRTTLVEIAEGIRVSDQAVSERLRRALLKPSTPAVGSDTDE
jgi:predicted DNA binding protein